MIKEIQLTVSPRTAAEDDALQMVIAEKLEIAASDITTWRIQKKSVDARQRDIKINLKIFVYLGEIPVDTSFQPAYQQVSSKENVIVVGSGPAGLFAALRLIEMGLRPIVFERGEDVSARKKSIALISRGQVVNPESNYCFGEGGAGTFSDGKLYTRSNKRGNIDRILQILHYHGAKPDILYEAHPHIGTDRLPEIIKNIRKTIIDCGGEIHFQTKLADIIISDGQVRGITTTEGDKIESRAVILATGHSARDVYEMLHNKGILLESKSFAIGVRVEHPQELIDQIQYHCKTRGDYLPASSYNLATQVNDRGVYSFCMCPGGFIVPSTTSDNEIVVNGMSSSARNSPYANAGIVVEIKKEDLKEFEKFGVLAGLYYQQNTELLAKQNGGQGQMAPAQRLTDFVSGKTSQSLPQSSYTPGIVNSPMHLWLPETISKRLQTGFTEFNKKMKGFLTQEAYITGVESRTSSPVRIPRLSDTLEHPQIKGLFPCGEGAGYAGGIVSSAMDGENVAEKVLQH
jgi:uncharacterized protein